MLHFAHICVMLIRGQQVFSLKVWLKCGALLIQTITQRIVMQSKKRENAHGGVLLLVKMQAEAKEVMWKRWLKSKMIKPQMESSTRWNQWSQEAEKQCWKSPIKTLKKTLTGLPKKVDMVEKLKTSYRIQNVRLKEKKEELKDCRCNLKGLLKRKDTVI